MIQYLNPIQSQKLSFLCLWVTVCLCMGLPNKHMLLYVTIMKEEKDDDSSNTDQWKGSRLSLLLNQLGKGFCILDIFRFVNH